MHDPSRLTMAGEHDADDFSKQKQIAISYIMDAWEEALADGVDSDFMANAALFAAFTDLVRTYGEDAVIKLAEGLPKRIEHGDFTLDRTTQ